MAIMLHFGPVLIIAFGLSPLALASDTFDPKLFGMPYVLWVSITLSILLILLTVLGTLVHPGSDNSLRKNDNNLYSNSNSLFRGVGHFLPYYQAEE